MRQLIAVATATGTLNEALAYERFGREPRKTVVAAFEKALSTASQEITLLMSVQRGPDYVRTAAREGSPISPKSDDRQPVKILTTAVLRALCFPKTAAALAKGSGRVAQIQKDFGVTKAQAEAAVALLGGGTDKSSWQVADYATKGGYVPFNTYSNDRVNGRTWPQHLSDLGVESS